MKHTFVVLVAVGILAGGAAAKEGVRATLTTNVDVHAQPGETIRVAGTLADREGRPFGGASFVRLLGRSGGSTVASAASRRGTFSADVAVPQDGIGGIRVGLRGRA